MPTSPPSTRFGRPAWPRPWRRLWPAGTPAAALATTFLFLGGCEGGGPAAPGPTSPPPLAGGLAPAAAGPEASPLALVLEGTGLREAELRVAPPLAIHVDRTTETEVAFRLSYRGASPGVHWISVETRTGRDSVAFTVEPLPPGDTLVEVRALWVSRWEHHHRDPEGLRELVRRAAAAGFNVLIFQVRGNGDAFHLSTLEPWSPLLSGALGAGPGWDPLGIVAEEAAARGVQVHAWINAFTGWSGGAPPPESSPRHAFLDHPDWVMVDAAGIPMPYQSGIVRWFSPGHPGVRSRLGAVAAELVRRYPVAGVHLDFIRYPGPAWSFDSPSLAAWDSMRATEPALTFDDARRRFVTMAVAEARDSMDVAAPGRELSAAVWGIYRNTRGWPSVSRGYEDRFQDPRRWDALGILDAVAPMVYWPMATEYGARLDFAWLADEHVAAYGAPVWVGVDAHALTGPELARHVERARLAGAEGVALFSFTALDADPSRWGWLQEGAFQWPARPPAPARSTSRP